MTEVVVTKTFEEKMKERIKASIGDLVSDEDLSKLVHKGVHEVFFSKKKIQVNSWKTEEGPSLIEGIVKDILGEQVRLEVNEWIKSNPEKVEEVIKNIVTEGVGMSVIKAFNSVFENQLMNFQMNIQNDITNR